MRFNTWKPTVPPSSPKKSADRSDTLPPLDAFVRVDRGGRTTLVHPEYAREVADALLDGVGCEPAGVAGRDAVHRFSYTDGTGIMRRYRRGGAVRFVLRESYFLVNRPLRELRVHHEAYAKGLPVPVPLGVMWEQRGPYVRGAIATQRIDAETLLDALQRPDTEAELRAAGAAVRAMHDAGLYHADLQVRNVLVAGDEAYIIDLDNGRWRVMTRSRRLRNLQRLQRSFCKAGASDDAFWTFCSGYSLDNILENALRDRVARRTTRTPRPWAGDVRVIVAQGIPESDVQRALEKVNEVLKVTAKSTTFRSGDWVVKCSPANFRWEMMRLLIGNNRYRRTWEALHRLRSRDVCVPAPIAYIEQRQWVCVKRAAVVIEYLAGWTNVEEHARTLVRERADDGAIATYLAEIAAAIRGLERAGAYHADLSGKNIMTDKGIRFAFIDLDGICFPRTIADRDRLRTHIQLYDSFCDYWSDRLLRPFIDALWPENAVPPEDWFDRVRMGQAVRRARQQARWRKQGVPTPHHLETRD